MAHITTTNSRTHANLSVSDVSTYDTDSEYTENNACFLFTK